MLRVSLPAALAVLLLALLPAAALAQDQGPGRARIQGRDEAAPAQPLLGPTPEFSEPRQAMRAFVESVSGYARGVRRDFAVIARGGLDLLVKVDPTDPNKVAPAIAYLRSIDGVMMDGVFYGTPEIDKPSQPKERQDRQLRFAKVARDHGLKVFVMDYATTPKSIDDAYRLGRAQGFVPFIAPARGLALNSLPRHPKRPFAENPNSIVSLRDAANFVFLADSSALGREDEFALRLHQTNFDVVIVDVFHGRRALTRQAVETLKYKNAGGRRLVLASMDIGAAASYRYYWQPHWQEGSPLWISAPFPDNPDRYRVEYWRPEWQRIISGNTESYTYGIIAQGFDGVVLDGLNAYRFFEGGAENAAIPQ